MFLHGSQVFIDNSVLTLSLFILFCMRVYGLRKERIWGTEQKLKF